MQWRYTITVQHVIWSDDGEDPFGNPIAGYEDPVDIDYVVAAPRYSSEPFEAGRNAVIIGYTLYLAFGTFLGPKDKVTLHGEEFEVEGVTGQWGPNPFTGDKPGAEVAIRRAAG